MPDILSAFTLDEHGLALFVDEMSLSSVTAGAANPSIFGFTTELGSIYLRTNGLLYVKTGALNTDWTQATTFDDLLAGNIEALHLVGSTYSTVQDFINILGSRGSFSGGIITSNGDGTIAVSDGTGMIHDADSSTSPLYFFNWTTNPSLSLTDISVNYVYVDYNSGTPQIVSQVSQTFDKRFILLGVVYRNGIQVSINNVTRLKVDNSIAGVVERFEATQPFAHAGGAFLGETGTRNITITSGEFWEGIDRLIFPAFDTSVTDTFTYWYRTASTTWVEVPAQTQIDVLQYNDPTSGLVNLGNNRFNNHWVYGGADGTVNIVYGLENTNQLATAQDAPIPPIPPDVVKFAVLLGRIIIVRNQNAFVQVDSAFEYAFQGASISNHNDLSNLQGGAVNEYFHQTSAEYSSWQTLDGTGTGLISHTGIGTWSPRTIIGTINRISITDGDGVSGNPTIDIAATYIGQTSITTLGTITTGTWNGTTIGTTFGGTGLTSYVQGDVLYASAVNTLASLPIGASATYLRSNGTIPAWSVIPGTEVTGQALTKVDDTNVTLTLGGTPATSLLRATSLTLGWTGQLAVSRGGTGVSTFGGTNTLLYTTTTDTLSSIPTANTSALVTNSTGVPGWTSGTTPNRLLRTNGTTITFAQVDLTTDVTGILPIANGGTGTTAGALADPGGNGVVVRTALNVTTNRTITGTTNRITLTNGSGVAGDPTIDIAATYVGQTSIVTLGTITTGTWNGTTIGTTFGGTGLISYTQGDLIYASAANTLTQLAKDTNATRYLSNTGASNNPAWAQINLANGVSGDLPFANLTQIAGLSVLGVTGTGTADVAAITGTANQVLRVNGAGTVLAFGSIDLSQAATVGTSILGIANGGTGTTAGALADPGGNGVVVRTGLNTTTNRTITGTTNRITLTNGDGVAGNPTIDIAATYVGQTSITTLGTITTGTWNGTTIALANGGTGTTTGLPLNNLIAATGANSINNGDNAQVWNTALTTAAKTFFTFTENTAATNGAGAQFLVDISTIAASTANPIRIRAQANNILTVTNVGVVTLQGSDTGTGSAATFRGGNSATAATAGGAVTVLGGTSGTSGTGGAANLTAGVGGTTGTGGTANITGGNGGSTSGNAGGVSITGGTPVAGTGGSITISGSAGVGTNQAGGSLTLTGGNPTGTGTPGSITLTAGALQGAGTPALVTIIGGAGNGATTGGAVNATAGSGGSTGTGAAITIRGGPGGSTSGAAGTATLIGGIPVDGNGGAVTVSGSAGVGTNRVGGAVSITGGNPTGTGTAGSVTVQGGALQGAGTPGAVNIVGGNGNGATTGGAAVVTGGTGGTTGAGAAVTITAGAGGGTSGNAGSVTISGGTPTAGSGGSITVTGTAGVGTNQPGGSITLTAGASTGSGAAGQIDGSATTTALRLPNGTSAQRPGQSGSAAIANGQMRYNTSQEIVEVDATLATPTSFSTFGILQRSTMLNRRRIWWKDDFITFLNTSFVGETNFQIGGTGTNTINNVTPTTDHMGVVQLQTGTTNGNATVIFHSGNSSSSPVINPAQMEYFCWLVFIPTITTVSITLGFGQNVDTDATFGTDGVFFRFNPATNAAWQFVTRAGSTSTTRTTTTTVVANTWYLLEGFYDLTQWVAVINGTANTANTTNIPTAMLANGARVQTNTGAARTLNIDYWSALSAEVGLRY